MKKTQKDLTKKQAWEKLKTLDQKTLSDFILGSIILEPNQKITIPRFVLQHVKIPADLRGQIRSVDDHGEIKVITVS